MTESVARVVGVREADRVTRLRAPLLTAGAFGLAALALHVRDPHAGGSWGFCPWLVLTGHYCPGCGGLRAVNDLTNGDLAAAASSNLLFVAAVPVLVFFWVRWTRRAWTGAMPARASRVPPGLLISAMVLLMAAFTVVRNLPAGSWLAP